MKQNIDMIQMEDEHLSMMIKLAFDMEDAEAVQRILDEPIPELSNEDAAFADAIFVNAMTSAEKGRKARKAHRMAATVRTLFPRIIEVAACIILVVAIAMPVALANSASFRAKVMQLIMKLDAEKGEAYFTFVEDEKASFEVPEGWIGTYFPSYIPDRFRVYDFDPFFSSVEYRDAQNNQLFFDECDEDTTMMTGTEDSEVRSMRINGQEGYLIDGIAADGVTHAVTLVWQNDTKWFSITGFGLSTNEVITIATSVKNIIK